jgi:Holliday junction resolvasome RuvABC endonuclease subunit
VKVGGLDLSVARTGVALPGRTFTIVGKGQGAERLAGIRRALRLELHPAYLDLVVIEGYGFGPNQLASYRLAELGGIVRLLLWDLGVPFIEVPPTSLKLWATGRGNASKDAMVEAAWNLSRDAFGVPTPFATDDEADAWHLWSLGMQIVGQPVFTPSADQRRALAKVIVPAGIRRRARLGASA